MRPMRWIATLVAVLALSGCIRLDQTLSLNKDGSGTFDVRYGMTEQTIGQLEMMSKMAEQMGEQAEGSDEMPFEFDEAAVREKFAADKPEGVELVSVSTETLDGWKYVDMKMTFTDLNALSKTEQFGDNDFSIAKGADGNYVISQRAASEEDMAGAGGAPGGDDAMAEGTMAQMAPMFAGLRMVTRVEVPGDIVETNATETEGRKASWVFDIDKDPAVLGKLQNANLKLVFKGDGVEIADFGAAPAE